MGQKGPNRKDSPSPGDGIWLESGHVAAAWRGGERASSCWKWPRAAQHPAPAPSPPHPAPAPALHSTSRFPPPRAAVTRAVRHPPLCAGRHPQVQADQLREVGADFLSCSLDKSPFPQQRGRTITSAFGVGTGEWQMPAPPAGPWTSYLAPRICNFLLCEQI